MNFDVKSLESGLKSFRIEIPVEDVNNELKNCYESLRQEASIPGFRKGRAPVGILKSRFVNYIRGEISRELISPACEEAIKSAEVDSLGDIEFVPKFEEIEIKDDQPIIFEILVKIKPEFDLPEYEDLQIDKSGVDVPEDEVDRFIEISREEYADYPSIEEDRSVHEGDFAKFDWEYYEDGEFAADGEDDVVEIPLEDTEEINQQYRFARELIGMSSGDEKEIELDFEDDYPDPNLAGKYVKYHVILLAIAEKVLPELDDEFAKKLDFESYEQMRGSAWNMLVERGKVSLNRIQRQEIVDELIEKTDLIVPDSVIQQQAHTVEESMKKRLRREGKSKRQIEAEIESMQDSTFSQTLRDIKQIWIFDEIAKREDIQVTDEELERQIGFMARHQDINPEKYTEMLEATKRLNGIKQSMVDEKIFDFLIEKASAKQKIIV